MNDYFDLARLAAPQPKSGGAWMRGQDLARQDGFIRQAQALAALNARMQAMDAEEKAAGAPGRLAKTRLEGALAEDDMADLPNILRTRREKRGAEDAKHNATRLQEQIKGIDQWVRAYEGAAPDQKGMIHRLLREEGVTIGKRRLGDMSPQEFDMTMRLFREAQKRSEALDKEKIKQDGATQRMKEGLDSKQKLAILKSRLDVEKNQALQSNKPMTMDQLTASVLGKALAAGEITQEELVQYHMDIKTYGADAGIAKAPPRTTLEDGKVKKVPVTPPPEPKNPLAGKGKGTTKTPQGAIDKYNKLLKSNPELKAQMDAEFKANGWEIPK